MSILIDIFHHFSRYTQHALSKEDVLDAMAQNHQADTGETLDWRKSLVDRMKLLRIDDRDTTFTKRKQMAAYYGINGYKGTESQNLALADAITDDMIG